MHHTLHTVIPIEGLSSVARFPRKWQRGRQAHQTFFGTTALKRISRNIEGKGCDLRVPPSWPPQAAGGNTSHGDVSLNSWVNPTLWPGRYGIHATFYINNHLVLEPRGEKSCCSEPS